MQKNHPINEVRYYLASLKILIERLDLERPLYKEGTTNGQVAFHTGQAANHWLRVVILRQSYERDRDAEFTEQPTLEKIHDSLQSALTACDELKQKDLDLTEKLNKVIDVEPQGFTVDTILGALIHVTAHTAEHFGELSQN